MDMANLVSTINRLNDSSSMPCACACYHNRLLVAYGGKSAEETIVHCEFDVTLLLAQKALPSPSIATPAPSS
jgi:hypothetical protein